TNATSTSVVQGIYADASSLSTLVSPAYWLRPSDAEAFCTAGDGPRNTTLVSTDQSFWNNVEMNYGGDWNVFKMTVEVFQTHDFSQTIIAPTNVYLSPDFSGAFTYDDT